MAKTCFCLLFALSFVPTRRLHWTCCRRATPAPGAGRPQTNPEKPGAPPPEKRKPQKREGSEEKNKTCCSHNALVWVVLRFPLFVGVYVALLESKVAKSVKSAVGRLLDMVDKPIADANHSESGTVLHVDHVNQQYHLQPLRWLSTHQDPKCPLPPGA